MTALEYILDGLEAELALERELGVRLVECDRSLLAPVAPASAAPAPAAIPRPAQPRPAPTRRPPAAPAGQQGTGYKFVFLHDRPLSPKGAEMVGKIVAAMGATGESAPVVVDGAMPRAKVYIALGAAALGKWMPDRKGGPGDWLKTDGGSDVLVTHSPESLVRFSVVTPAVMKLKRDMWTSLKEVVRRTASA